MRIGMDDFEVWNYWVVHVLPEQRVVIKSIERDAVRPIGILQPATIMRRTRLTVSSDLAVISLVLFRRCGG